MSIFWEVIVSVNLSQKNVYVHVSYYERFPRQGFFNEQEFGFGAQYCPSLPPYCAPLDYFLWGWMKSKVYRTKVDTRDELIDRIMDVIDSIKGRQDTLRQATYHVLTRVSKCTNVDGGIFEKMYCTR